MKKLVAIVMVGLAGVVGTAGAQEAAKLPLAVIDVQQVVQESAAGKESMARLQKLQNDKITEGKRLNDVLETLRKQVATQRATLTDAKVAELEKQIEDKQVEMRRFQDDAQQQLEEGRRSELEALEKQIMPIINELGRELKLQLIFNKFQSGLVFADETLDITDQVLRRFNTKVTK
ncbi:MAG: OmpH family outer membrane protein [Acidobacteriota bacterium]